MDDRKKITLSLMEHATIFLRIRDAGYQLILIAADWIKEGDESRARDALSKIDDFYYDNFYINDVEEKLEIAEATILLIEAFGITDFKLLRERGLKA
jgi:hypothetical protein